MCCKLSKFWFNSRDPHVNDSGMESWFHMFKYYYWSDPELQYQNFKFRIWIISQPAIYIIPQYELYGVLTLYSTIFPPIIYLLWGTVNNNYMLGKWLFPPCYIPFTKVLGEYNFLCIFHWKYPTFMMAQNKNYSHGYQVL